MSAAAAATGAAAALPVAAPAVNDDARAVATFAKLHPKVDAAAAQTISDSRSRGNGQCECARSLKLFWTGCCLADAAAATAATAVVRRNFTASFCSTPCGQSARCDTPRCTLLDGDAALHCTALRCTVCDWCRPLTSTASLHAALLAFPVQTRRSLPHCSSAYRHCARSGDKIGSQTKGDEMLLRFACSPIRVAR